MPGFATQHSAIEADAKIPAELANGSKGHFTPLQLDASAVAAVAAAQAAQTAAEGSAETRYNTKAGVEAATIAAVVKTVEITGYAAAGDGGAALYKRVTAQPSHAHRIRSTDRFMPDGSTNATHGGWWEYVSLVSTPVSLGYAMDGTPNAGASGILGSPGNWDTGGSSVVRAAWTVNSTFPSSNQTDYDLGLTGHFMHEDARGAFILGGMPTYYSAVGNKANASLTFGGDNYNGHIAGMLLSQHSDLIDDASGFAIGDHGCIIGGAFHIAAGTYPSIVGGEETQCYGSYSFMGGGFNNIIGDPAGAANSHKHNGMIGGTAHDLKGQYNAMTGGRNNVTTATALYSGHLGGFNNVIGDGTSDEGMACVGGINHLVYASGGVALGGANNTINAAATNAVTIGTRAVANHRSEIVQSSGRFSADGDAQKIETIAYGSGTTPIIPNVSNGGGLYLFNVPTGTSATFTIDVNVVQTGGATGTAGDTWGYHIEGVCVNVGGTLSIKAQVVRSTYEEDAAFVCAAEVLGTRIGCRVTGNANRNIRVTQHAKAVMTSFTS